MHRSRWLVSSLAAVGFGLSWVGLVAAMPTASLERVSVASDGSQANDRSGLPVVSGDGRYVAFQSAASNLVAGDSGMYQDVFVHDRVSGETTRVSVDASGTEGNGASGSSAVSGDGRYVAFVSSASNLVAGDTNGHRDVFVHDQVSGETTRVSVDASGIEGNGASGLPTVSGDGHVVAFQSSASNLVAGDTNGHRDVFVHDRMSGETTRVSVDTSGTEGNAESGLPMMSGDGRYVAFDSLASNLVAGDTNGHRDVFVHDRMSGETTRVSVDASGIEGNGDSGSSAVSGDGRYVAFVSWASNLVAGDSGRYQDVFVHDRMSGETTRVSVDASGTEINAESGFPAVSGDGRYVAFQSWASNLVAGDTNGHRDVFVHDRMSGETTRVSVDASGAETNSYSELPAVSADGHVVAFQSLASNLVPGDTNATVDVFVWHGNTPPMVDNAFWSVAEDTSVGTSVGTVEAADADGDTLSYAITAGNTSGTFAIDDATGEIILAGRLNYESAASYSLRVSVSDGSLANTATVTIVPDAATFTDVTETHPFYGDIGWLAWSGITVGCNPPVNDMFCPSGYVTRAQMAAFLHRALDGVLLSGAPVTFVDDDGSIFEADIEWLGAAGVTVGCNPPVNDMFCPSGYVTRAQMAAFLHRALDGVLLPGAPVTFVDDDGSIFEADIEWLGAAGVTVGCNPPVNDMFCPSGYVTRAQMAAFLHRALG